jgi:peptidoglycan/xylan/chitin deacetylase (PgdA/CDA1 family)
VTQAILYFLHRSGFPAAARLFPRRHLVVLNFHRVREEASPFHEGMIEINPQRFREHLGWISKRVTFVGEKQILTLQPGKRTKMMLTFDDGYSESHEVIAPILEELGIPATFFVAPALIDRRVLGAWDRIAYLVKKVQAKRFQFRGHEFSLEKGTRNIYLQLGRMSQNSIPDQGDEFVNELALSLGISLPTAEEQSRELLTWNQIRDLERRGFSIGCHGFSHRVLSSLSREEQEDEILLARARLTAEGLSHFSFAYPFGSPKSYSWETRDAAIRAGYRLIFSFSGQAPKIRQIDPTQIDRVAFKSSIAKYDFLVSLPGAHNLAQKLRRSRHE